MGSPDSGGHADHLRASGRHPRFSEDRPTVPSDLAGVLSSDLFWRPVCDLETKGKIQGNTCCHADEGVWCPTAELYGGKGSEGEPLVTIHYPPSAHWNRTPKIELPLLVLLSDPT